VKGSADEKRCGMKRLLHLGGRFGVGVAVLYCPYVTIRSSGRKLVLRWDLFEASTYQQKAPASLLLAGAFNGKAGDGLLSHHLSVVVPSALQGLTAVFGMGTGVAPAR
jgi:hypothetical protein